MKGRRGLQGDSAYLREDAEARQNQIGKFPEGRRGCFMGRKREATRKFIVRFFKKSLQQKRYKVQTKSTGLGCSKTVGPFHT